MVTPERLVPGIGASTWATPMNRATPRVMWQCSCLRPEHVGDQHEDGVENAVPRNDRDVPFKIGHVQLFQHEPEGDGRDGGKPDIDHEPAFRRYLAHEQEQRALDELDHVAPEIDEYGEERAKMHHDVGELALVGPAVKGGDENEMSGG